MEQPVVVPPGMLITVPMIAAFIAANTSIVGGVCALIWRLIRGEIRHETETMREETTKLKLLTVTHGDEISKLREVRHALATSVMTPIAALEAGADKQAAEITDLKQRIFRMEDRALGRA